MSRKPTTWDAICAVCHEHTVPCLSTELLERSLLAHMRTLHPEHAQDLEDLRTLMQLGAYTFRSEYVPDVGKVTLDGPTIKDIVDEENTDP